MSQDILFELKIKSISNILAFLSYLICSVKWCSHIFCGSRESQAMNSFSFPSFDCIIQSEEKTLGMNKTCAEVHLYRPMCNSRRLIEIQSHAHYFVFKILNYSCVFSTAILKILEGRLSPRSPIPIAEEGTSSNLALAKPLHKSPLAVENPNGVWV